MTLATYEHNHALSLVVPHSSKELLWFQWHFWPICHLVVRDGQMTADWGYESSQTTHSTSRDFREDFEKTFKKNKAIKLIWWSFPWNKLHPSSLGHHWAPCLMPVGTIPILGFCALGIASLVHTTEESHAKSQMGRCRRLVSLVADLRWSKLDFDGVNDHRFVDLESDFSVKKSEVPQILVFTTFVLIGLHEAIMTFSSTRPANSWRWTCMIQTSGQAGLGNLEIWEWKWGHHSQCSSPEAVWLYPLVN